VRRVGAKFIAAALAIVLAASSCGGGDLQQDIEKAHSLAAAAQFLASQASAGELTGPYVRAQSEELAKSADDLDEQIASDQGDRAQRDRAQALVRTVRDSMRRLSASPGDRAAAQDVAARLKAATK
jgi:hypothetical protein